MKPVVALVMALVVALAAGCADDVPGGSAAADEHRAVRAAVAVVATGCGPADATGSGMVTEPGIVLTAAHVVAGATAVEVSPSGGSPRPAEIVAFDPDMDLARLAVDTAGIDPFPVASAPPDEVGDAIAYTVRDGIVERVPVVLRRPVTIVTEDIYVEGSVRRPGYELDASVATGDSGAAIVAGDGVVGVVWARHRRTADRAYAIDPVAGSGRLDEQRRTGPIDVDLGRCP